MKLTLNNVGIKKTVNVTITNRIARNALQVAKTANASEAADSEDVALSGQISMIGEVIDFLADVFNSMKNKLIVSGTQALLKRKTLLLMFQPLSLVHSLCLQRRKRQKNSRRKGCVKQKMHLKTWTITISRP
ncbi:hypothetical protein S101258_00449 [Lactiplantibacillus plantarum subsp. plantarum]|uniref:Uncharacterized protein n=1 Tax=Lactiplantibacillus plantarum subsp. plantarum TaxID=337330 RepID=A0A2S3U916_LACPN|nr:hypothetical protein S101258_00449 [Lactiplantibacillus plantarum subsp. plantarum]